MTETKIYENEKPSKSLRGLLSALEEFSHDLDILKARVGQIAAESKGTTDGDLAEVLEFSLDKVHALSMSDRAILKQTIRAADEMENAMKQMETRFDRLGSLFQLILGLDDRTPLQEVVDRALELNTIYEILRNQMHGGNTP